MPARGGLTRNRLPLISRWKILDNLRRSLLAPAIVALFLFGWTIAPGRAAVWTAMTAGALAFPVALGVLAWLRGPHAGQTWGMFARTSFEDLRADAARVAGVKPDLVWHHDERHFDKLAEYSQQHLVAGCPPHACLLAHRVVEQPGRDPARSRPATGLPLREG